MKPISRRVGRSVFKHGRALSITAVKLNKFRGEWSFFPRAGRGGRARQKKYDRACSGNGRGRTYMRAQKLLENTGREGK